MLYFENKNKSLMIYFNNVSKIYPDGFKVLNNINFYLYSGEILFLKGHSGAGKSTLLKLIIGIECLSTGFILFNGYDISFLKKHEMPFLRRQIGIIFQCNNLLLDKTVYYNIAISKFILGFNDKDIRYCVLSALDKVGMLDKEKKYPSQLSICEQQYVCIARAIVSKPLLLLIDEPVCNLDIESSKKFFYLFKELNKIGITILVTINDCSLIEFDNYRVLTLSKGCLIKN